MTPPVLLERGIDIQLDHHPRLHSRVAQRLARAVTNRPGHIVAGHGCDRPATCNTTASSRRAAGGNGEVHPHTRSRPLRFHGQRSSVRRWRTRRARTQHRHRRPTTPAGGIGHHAHAGSSDRVDDPVLPGSAHVLTDGSRPGYLEPSWNRRVCISSLHVSHAPAVWVHCGRHSVTTGAASGSPARPGIAKTETKNKLRKILCSSSQLAAPASWSAANALRIDTAPRSADLFVPNC